MSESELISQPSHDSRTTGEFCITSRLLRRNSTSYLAIMSRALFFSFLFPLLALAQSSLPPAGNNGGDDNPPDPTDAGAAGSQKGAFTLSNGALAAIIVVVVIVVIGGSMLPLQKSMHTSLTFFSCFRNSMVARKEATMGRSTIDPPRITPYHWSRKHRQQAKPPETKNWYPSQLASSRKEHQAKTRARS